jgi:hypothetical protein
MLLDKTLVDEMKELRKRKKEKVCRNEFVIIFLKKANERA